MTLTVDVRTINYKTLISAAETRAVQKIVAGLLQYEYGGVSRAGRSGTVNATFIEGSDVPGRACDLML